MLRCRRWMRIRISFLERWFNATLCKIHFYCALQSAKRVNLLRVRDYASFQVSMTYMPTIEQQSEHNMQIRCNKNLMMFCLFLRIMLCKFQRDFYFHDHDDIDDDSLSSKLIKNSFVQIHFSSAGTLSQIFTFIINQKVHIDRLNCSIFRAMRKQVQAGNFSRPNINRVDVSTFTTWPTCSLKWHKNFCSTRKLSLANAIFTIFWSALINTSRTNRARHLTMIELNESSWKPIKLKWKHRQTNSHLHESP